jgi:hypothetical protein
VFLPQHFRFYSRSLNKANENQSPPFPIVTYSLQDQRWKASIHQQQQLSEAYACFKNHPPPFPIVKYKLQNGIWVPRVDQNAITFLYGWLTSDFIRSDNLVITFFHSSPNYLSLTGVIGTFVSTAEFIDKKLFEWHKNTPSVWFRPSIYFYQNYLFLFLPGVQATAKSKWLNTPIDCPDYQECVSHASRFMREICSNVLFLISPLKSNSFFAQEKDETNIFMSQKNFKGNKFKSQEIRFFGNSLTASV